MPRGNIHTYETSFVVGIKGEANLETLAQLADDTKQESVGSVNVSSIPKHIASDLRSMMPNKYSRADLFFVLWSQKMAGVRSLISYRSWPTLKREIPPMTLRSMQGFYASAQEEFCMIGYGFFEFQPGQYSFKSFRQPTR